VKVNINDLRKFLTKNGYKKKDLKNGCISYLSARGELSVDFDTETQNIILCDNNGNETFLPFNYYALVGALIEFRQIPFNYISIN